MRSVACMSGNATAAAGACAGRAPPPASRACNAAPCVGYAWQARGHASAICLSVRPSSWLNGPHVVVGALSVFRSGHAMLLLQMEGTDMGHLRDHT